MGATEEREAPHGWVVPPTDVSKPLEPGPTDPMLQFFAHAHAHLPPAMQAVSRPFCELAGHIVETLPRNPERTVALRKLLEAKDCALRATIWKG